MSETHRILVSGLLLVQNLCLRAGTRIVGAHYDAENDTVKLDITRDEKADAAKAELADELERAVETLTKERDAYAKREWEAWRQLRIIEGENDTLRSALGEKGVANALTQKRELATLQATVKRCQKLRQRGRVWDTTLVMVGDSAGWTLMHTGYTRHGVEAPPTIKSYLTIGEMMDDNEDVLTALPQWEEP